MPKTIHKYLLTLDRAQTLSLPFDAEVLSVQLQNGRPALWATVNPDNKLVPCCIHCLPTGGEGPASEWKHIGTVQLQHDGTVWHFFSA